MSLIQRILWNATHSSFWQGVSQCIEEGGGSRGHQARRRERAPRGSRTVLTLSSWKTSYPVLLPMGTMLQERQPCSVLV